MYYSHFGLTQAPFRITPNTEFFFAGGNRGSILEALIYAISHGEGIVKVTGEVGSGKTMLCSMLQARLPPGVDTIYLANPSVPPDDILQAIAFELQLGVDRGANRLEVMQSIHRHLLERHAADRRVVMFVEESQSMPLATLEEIRLLSNLETRSDKLLQIVLFGQPELDDNLAGPAMRPLKDRIAHSFRLEPLDDGEIREYLMFRMRTAGYRGPDLFSAPVVKQVARATGGLTRRVNLVADKALLAAFAENTHTIQPRHVEAAVRDSEFGRPRGARIGPSLARGAALVVAGAAIGAAAYALLQHDGSITRTGSVPARPATSPAPAASRETPGTEARGAGPLPSAALDVGAIPDEKNKISVKTTAYETPEGGGMGSGHAVQEAAPARSATSMTSPVSGLAAASGGAAAPQSRAAADLVRQRLAATQEWLAHERPATLTIQLMGTDNEQQLKHELDLLSRFVDMNGIFVYRTMAKEKPSVTVVYGKFASLGTAQDVLDKLPPFLKANRPILRTVQGIRAEIEQHRKF